MEKKHKKMLNSKAMKNYGAGGNVESEFHILNPKTKQNGWDSNFKFKFYKKFLGPIENVESALTFSF